MSHFHISQLKVYADIDMMSPFLHVLPLTRRDLFRATPVAHGSLGVCRPPHADLIDPDPNGRKL